MRNSLLLILLLHVACVITRCCVYAQQHQPGDSFGGAAGLRRKLQPPQFSSAGAGAGHDRRRRRIRLPNYILYFDEDHYETTYYFAERVCKGYDISVAGNDGTFMVRGGDPNSYQGFTDFNLNVNVEQTNCATGASDQGGGDGGTGSLTLLPNLETKDMERTEFYSLRKAPPLSDPTATTDEDDIVDFFFISARLPPINDDKQQQHVVIVINPNNPNEVNIWVNAILDFGTNTGGSNNNDDVIAVRDSETGDEVGIPNYIFVNAIVSQT